MRVYILCAIILSLFLAAGSMSYDDELKAAQHYQDMVCAKSWPPTQDHPLSACPKLDQLNDRICSEGCKAEMVVVESHE